MGESGPSFKGPPPSHGTPVAPEPAVPAVRESSSAVPSAIDTQAAHPINLPEVGDVSSLGTTIRQLLTESPPDIPESGGSTEFWSTVGILRQPNVTYGDMRIVPVAADATAIRQAFEWKMHDEKGNEIGCWTKRGFFVGQQKRLAILSENVSLPNSKEELTVQVGFNRENQISYVDLETTKNYEPTAHTQVRYAYDSAGNVIEQELYSIKNILHPETGRPTHEYTRLDLPKPYTVLADSPPPTDYLPRPPSQPKI